MLQTDAVALNSGSNLRNLNKTDIFYVIVYYGKKIS